MKTSTSTLARCVAGFNAEDLKEAIRYSRHMLVLLTPDFLERCSSDPDDVVRQELATALLPVVETGKGASERDSSTAALVSHLRRLAAEDA